MWQENGWLTYVSVNHELALQRPLIFAQSSQIVVITTNYYWMNSSKAKTHLLFRFPGKQENIEQQGHADRCGD